MEFIVSLLKSVYDAYFRDDETLEAAGVHPAMTTVKTPASRRVPMRRNGYNVECRPMPPDWKVANVPLYRDFPPFFPSDVENQLIEKIDEGISKEEAEWLDTHDAYDDCGCDYDDCESDSANCWTAGGLSPIDYLRKQAELRGSILDDNNDQPITGSVEPKGLRRAICVRQGFSVLHDKLGDNWKDRTRARGQFARHKRAADCNRKTVRRLPND